MISRKEIAFTVLIGLIFLVLLELLFRFYLNVILEEQYPSTSNKSLLSEWRWAAEHLEIGSAYRPNSHIQFDELRGWALNPSYSSEQLSTNSSGLRASQEYEVGPRTSDVQRLLLLGDSFTYGEGVANEETFAHILESDLLSGWEVINMAVQGYGTDQQLLTYDHFGKKYEADIVLLGFYVGDYYRNTMTFKVYSKPIFTKSNGIFKVSNLPLQRPEELYRDYELGVREIGYPWYQSMIYHYLDERISRISTRNITENDPEWEVLAWMMKKFTENIRSENARPYWVVIPHRGVLTGETRYSPLKGLMKEWARQLNLPYLDLSSTFCENFQKDPGSMLYRDIDIGGHLSAYGHKVVAESLYEFIRESEASPAQDY
jgi:GDSL-like lipase/acylhydrolase family protein